MIDLSQEFHPQPKPIAKEKGKPKALGVGKKTKKWEAIIKNWEKLMNLWIEECRGDFWEAPKLFNKMQQLGL